METNKNIGAYNLFFYATMCHVCKRFGDGVRLRRCGGCRMIAYCGRQHQKQHWTQHKSLCKAIQDVLRDYRLEGRGVTSEEWDDMKYNLMLLVSFKLGRCLETYEREMFVFPRECAVCHERDAQLLDDCRSCRTVSFCRDHKGSVKHKDTCVILELCLRTNLSFISGTICPADLHYVQHILDTDTIRNMKDLIDTFGNIRTDSKMYDLLAARHSEYLTRPLTLFHAMRILNFVPKRERLVVHVVAAASIEEFTLTTWEVLLHVLRAPVSLVVVMIGPELTADSFIPLQICKNCTLQKKELVLEFHQVLYENYARRRAFKKPDLIIGFNVGIHANDMFNMGTWAPFVQTIAEQNCPFILTAYMQRELGRDMDRICTILNRKVNCLYSGKNLFASLRPFRVPSPEQVFYQNHYLVVYRSLCS